MKRFRCTCTWAAGENILPMSHFEEILRNGNTYCEELLAKLHAAKIGDEIAHEEPFNGMEYFTRIE